MKTLVLRSRILQSIRSFFVEREFVEVQTPVRIAAPATETHIDAEPSGDYYLRTSPELHMKRLLAAGCERIFQIGPCFRKNEHGKLHHPEFTMLEWYRTNSDYTDMLVDTKSLILKIARDIRGDTEISYQGQSIDLLHWERITVDDAFLLHAGWSPVVHYDANRFDIDLVEKVEPALPRGIPVILTDYPVEAAGLSRTKPSDMRVAERWELYIGGFELANAYSELIDADEQASRFEACRQYRTAAGKDNYPMDYEFLKALESGLPPSSGIALGVDRMVMLFADDSDLDDVLVFRE